jgi:predicted nucleic acid-binding protein
MSYTPKIFLDASVFNFYIDGKQGKKRLKTIELFDAIKDARYAAYSSAAVIEELKDAPQEKSDEMLDLVEKYTKKVFPISDEIRQLSGIYVKNNIIPVGSMTDAIHIATATVNDMDFVVSCNMGHVVKQKTMIGTGFINLRAGYKQIGLSSSMEVIEYDV